MNQIQDIKNKKVEIINSKNSKNIGGYKVTYEPHKDKFVQIELEYKYISADELKQISELLIEFQSIIDEYSEKISFVVGNIVLSSDKPIKIRRIIE